MKNYVSNEPNASKLMESLRSTGYDNYSAIADIIDNSFDANADLVKIEIGSGKDDDYIIKVADNGEGMKPKIIEEALRLGSITDRDDETLGKYGMGLITASISIGQRLTVISKHQGSFYTGIHDLEHIVAKNKFEVEVRKSKETEKNMFMSYLGTANSGTIVVISKIDNMQNKNVTSFSNRLIKLTGEIFRDFLNANKVIQINTKTVHATDPMWRDDPETVKLLDESKEFEVNDGMSPLRLRVFELPKLSATESKARNQNIPNQGFYLMRNNRQIEAGNSLDIFKKHNDFNRFRAEVYFNGALDQKIGVNFKKDGISLSDDIRSWLERKSHPHINAIRTNAKKSQKQNTKKINHESTEKNIKSKSSVLKKPRSDDDDPVEEGKFQSLRSEDFANVEFKVESNSHLAPLFIPEVKGNKLIIRFNSDHTFYQTVYSDPDNKDLINAIDSFIYSSTLSLIDITSSEDRIELRDRFLDLVSDNLRALLN